MLTAVRPQAPEVHVTSFASRHSVDTYWPYTLNGKDSQHSNNHNFISVQDIDTVFCMVGFSGSAISNMPSKFSREPIAMASKFRQN